jgi:hypothetical protein
MQISEDKEDLEASVGLEVLAALEASQEVSQEDLVEGKEDSEDSETMTVRKKSKKKEKRRKSHKRLKRKKKCLTSMSTDRTAIIDVHSIIEL